MMLVFAGNWWSIALRGLAAVLFGILAFVWPALTLIVLVFLFAGYAFADGILAIASGARGDVEGRNWLLILSGGVGVLAAVVTVFWPGITALALLAVIAAWALITGVLEIAAAYQLRHEMNHVWPLALNGALSVLFGLAVIVFPGAGALAVVWLIGAYAIVSGIALLLLAYRLRGRQSAEEESRFGGGQEGLAH